MRYIFLVICASVVLAIALAVGCTATGNQRPLVAEASPLGTIRQEATPEDCLQLSGVWRTYEFPQGTEKNMCGDEPCEGEGYSGPLKLECQEGKVIGSKLLMFASHPAPGKEVRASIVATWEKGKLLLSYTDSSQCLVTYTVSLKDKKLAGDFSVRDCVGKNWRGDRGEFLAIKSSN